MTAFWKAPGPCLVAVGLLASLSCGGPLGPEDLARIEVAAGNDQEAPAGTAVPIQPAVRALSQDGEPIPGAIVTFVVTDGDGILIGGEATSNAEGIATVTSWTLGETAGSNVLNATAEGAPETAIFRARGVVGPPAIVEKLAGDEQTVTAGLPVLIVPRVRVTDQFGNRNAELEVTFSTTGGGSVGSETAITDEDGEVSPDSWTLGNTPGPNTLLVTAEEASTTFTATGISGPVAIGIQDGDGQTATAGSSVAIRPQVIVTDALGIAVADVPVSFAVTAGGGSVDVSEANTDAGGIASVDWTLGTAVGTNTLRATLVGLGAVDFTATSVPDVPATLEVNSGDQQVGAVGLDLPAPPSVLVSDQFGNPVPDVSVTFTVTAGGGSITGSPAVTNASGIATADTWTLGPTEGPNTVDAAVSGLPPLTFTATALASVYDIEIVRLGAGGPAIAQALDDAAARWEQLIIGDLVDVSFATNPIDSAACGVPHPTIDDTVDDIRIYVRLIEIDGPGNVLGSAGPCVTRTTGGLTVVGVMRLDTEDLNNLETQGLLEDLVVHEIGHALGFGTLWDDFDLLVNPSLPTNEGVDTHFTGAGAIAAFDAAGGTSYTGGEKVPVENSQGGSGTRDSHWRESILQTELLTGFIDSQNELSAITVESLGDLGYVINPAASDPYTLPGTTPPSLASRRSLGIQLVDDVYRGPIYVVERDGFVRAVIRQ